MTRSSLAYDFSELLAPKLDIGGTIMKMLPGTTIASRRKLVMNVLEDPLHGDFGTGEIAKWTVQGFGFIRLYMPNDCRLNIWHHKLTYDPQPSMLHTHPWNFVSEVVHGLLVNKRYRQVPAQLDNDEGGPVVYRCASFKKKRIRPGICIMDLSEPTLVSLVGGEAEVYTTGQSYYQDAHEIHETMFVDGTITINARERVGNDEADVLWLHHGRGGAQEWVSAEPRPATDEEVLLICSEVLDRMKVGTI